MDPVSLPVSAPDRPRGPLLLVGLLLVAWAGCFLALLRHDAYGVPGEAMLDAVVVHDRLAGDLPPGALPSLPSLVGAAGVAWDRGDPAAIVATQLLWVVLLAASAWALARRFGGPWTGAGAACATLLAPGVALYAHWFSPDLALAAVVTLALAVALHAGDLDRMRWALALGLVAGLGLRVEWTFLLYTAPLLAWVAWKAARGRHLLQLAAALALLLAGSLPFGLQAPREFPVPGPPGLDFALVLLWVPLSLAALAGAVDAWRWGGADGRALVLSGTVSLLLASSSHGLPLVGWAAALAALWGCGGRPWRRWVFVAAVAPGALGLVAWMVPPGALPGFVHPTPAPTAAVRGPLPVPAPFPEASRTRELAEEIAFRSAGLGREARVLYAGPPEGLGSLRYALAVGRVPVVDAAVPRLQDFDPARTAWRSGFRLKGPPPAMAPEAFDFVVVGEDVRVEPAEGRLVPRDGSGEGIRPGPRVVDLGSFPLADGGSLRLVANAKDPPNGLVDVPPGGLFSPTRPPDWTDGETPSPERFFDPYTDVGRDAWQKPDRLWEAMGLAPGMEAADVGAGYGYFTFHMADAVGPEGLLWAVDVDPLPLSFVRERARREGRRNVLTLLRKPEDTGLPAGRLDAAFLGNTFQTAMYMPHGHMEWRLRTHPPEWYFRESRVGDFLASIHRALKPGGILGVVDEDEPHTPPDVTAKLIESAGFRLVSRHDFIQGNYFLVFRRVP